MNLSILLIQQRKIVDKVSERRGAERQWGKKMYRRILLGFDKVPDIIKKGSKGGNVAILQTELNFAGFNCGISDGVFGPKTESAVRKYQKTAGLVADGVAGPVTWTALLSAYVVELEPGELKARLISGPGEKIAGTTANFVNANFFNGKNTIGWLASEGEILADRDYHVKWGGLYDKPKGTFIVYKDGRVEAGQKTDGQLAEMRAQVSFCCQGFNLPATGDINASIKSEGFDPGSVGYRTTRLAIGYNETRAVILVQKLSDATRVRRAMESVGCGGRSICLDSGGSVNLWVDGAAIFKTNRTLTNIVYW